MDNRSQEDGKGMPVPLGYNPPPIRLSAFSKLSLPPTSSVLLLSPNGGGSRNVTDLGNTTSIPPTIDPSSTTTDHPLQSRSTDPDPIHTTISSPDPTSGAGGPNSRAAVMMATTIKYRECLRNHAASTGGYVLDGCCEFMPSNDDGFKCAACGCHRSFHQKETEGDPNAGSYYRRNRFPVPLLLPPPHPSTHHHHHHANHHHLSHKQFTPTGFPPSPSGIVQGSSAAVAFGGNNSGSGATTESSSEERFDAGALPPMVLSKKRFRTKFTAEQKEKMLGFAERVGWRIQKQDEAVVEQICKEVGVRRQVLKVWMHNNKHSTKKQQQQQEQDQQQQPQQQQQQQSLGM